jgi:hypothetical protein
MPVPEPAQFFGFSFDTWTWLFIAILGTVAAVVVAKQKRRRWAELGDGEDPLPHDEAQRDHRHDASSDNPPPR